MSEAKSTIVPYAYHRSFRYRQQLTWEVPISNDDLVPVIHSSQHLEQVRSQQGIDSLKHLRLLYGGVSSEA